jgi:hypothetical protein
MHALMVEGDMNRQPLDVTGEMTGVLPVVPEEGIMPSKL